MTVRGPVSHCRDVAYCDSVTSAGLQLDAQAFGHLVVEKALAWTVGLDPFTVNDELGDRAQTGVFDYLLSGAGSSFNVDVLERNIVFMQKALGHAAVRTPKGGIDSQFHGFI
jgi:hypothetical protein